MKSITVRELIDLLNDQDPDAKVIFASNYGDRGRTQQAHAIRGRAEEVAIEESAYSDSGFAVAEDDGRDIDEKFVLIK